jgi:ankyrin repeat protein
VNGYTAIVEYLLFRKAEIEIIDRFKRNCLHWAAVTNNAKIAQILVKHGSDINLKDAELNTPYDLAKKNNNKEAMSYLKVCQIRKMKEEKTKPYAPRKSKRL